jgi:lipopolysaccharide export system protein LptA
MNPRAASFLLVLVAMAPFAAAVAKTSDRNQTMHTQSDRTDCSVGDTAPCLLIGSVHVMQGTLDITAAKADVRRADGDISMVKLTGSPVRMKQQNDDGGWVNATAAQIDYDMPNDTIVLTGDASVQQPGRGGITGGRIVYNTKTGQVQSGGSDGGGRVNMTFEPKNKPPARDSKAAPAAGAPAPNKPNPDKPNQDKK